MIDSDAGCDINLNPAVIGCFASAAAAALRLCKAKPGWLLPSVSLHSSQPPDTMFSAPCIAWKCLFTLHPWASSPSAMSFGLFQLPGGTRRVGPTGLSLLFWGYLFPKMEVGHRAVVCLVRPSVFLFPPPHQPTDKWLRCLFALINELSALETALKPPLQPGFQMPTATEILTG